MATNYALDWGDAGISKCQDVGYSAAPQAADKNPRAIPNEVSVFKILNETDLMLYGGDMTRSLRSGSPVFKAQQCLLS